MKLYLARHGETDWNTQGLLQGQTDIPLNETGRAQAQALGELLRSQDLRFDAVYASPLSRTHDTAKIAVEDQYSIILDARLGERGLGELEGQPFSRLRELEGDLFDLAQNVSDYQVEPIRDFHARAQTFLDFLRASYPADANILAVASSGFMRRIHTIVTGEPSNAPVFQNARVYLYEI